MKIQELLADTYAFELGRFMAELGAVPAGHFHTPRLGHSPAWHALHVAEWLRFFQLQDSTPTYAHLGWEQADWLPPLLGTPPVAETAERAAILAEVDRVRGLIVGHVAALRDEQLGEMLRFPAIPEGQRVRSLSLQTGLLHIAYHRGQLQLSQKDIP